MHRKQLGHQSRGTARAPPGWRRGPRKARVPGEPRGLRAPAPHKGARPGLWTPLCLLVTSSQSVSPERPGGKRQWPKDSTRRCGSNGSQTCSPCKTPVPTREEEPLPIGPGSVTSGKLPTGSQQVPRACPLVPRGPSRAGGSWRDVELAGSPGYPRLLIRAAGNLTLTEMGRAAVSWGRTTAEDGQVTAVPPTEAGSEVTGLS